jgi:prepilin peptidase CpaA
MLTALILISVTVAAYFDLRWRRIPNWLVVVTIGAALTWHAVTGGISGFWLSLAGLTVGAGVLLPLFLLRGMGAGDVKLFGALGAAVTYNHVFTVLFISLIVAGVMALVRVVLARALVATLVNIVDLLGRFLRGRISPHPRVNLANEHALAIPFGVSVAVATWIFILTGAR